MCIFFKHYYECHHYHHCLGITEAELATGYLCDPSTKSELRILARPGLLIRLSRNFDKQRGFVNGALAEVCEALRGNSIFTARLVGSGNMVLVHPMEEQGAIFLPCCYGYGSTIRRSQGADLDLGCIYFDQKMSARRVYGYVAASRFKSRAGLADAPHRCLARRRGAAGRDP